MKLRFRRKSNTKVGATLHSLGYFESRVVRLLKQYRPVAKWGSIPLQDKTASNMYSIQFNIQLYYNIILFSKQGSSQHKIIFKIKKKDSNTLKSG